MQLSAHYKEYYNHLDSSKFDEIKKAFLGKINNTNDLVIQWIKGCVLNNAHGKEIDYSINVKINFKGTSFIVTYYHKADTLLCDVVEKSFSYEKEENLEIFNEIDAENDVAIGMIKAQIAILNREIDKLRKLANVKKVNHCQIFKVPLTLQTYTYKED